MYPCDFAPLSFLSNHKRFFPKLLEKRASSVQFLLHRRARAQSWDRGMKCEQCVIRYLCTLRMDHCRFHFQSRVVWLMSTLKDGILCHTQLQVKSPRKHTCLRWHCGTSETHKIHSVDLAPSLHFFISGKVGSSSEWTSNSVSVFLKKSPINI